MVEKKLADLIETGYLTDLERIAEGGLRGEIDDKLTMAALNLVKSRVEVGMRELGDEGFTISDEVLFGHFRQQQELATQRLTGTRERLKLEAILAKNQRREDLRQIDRVYAMQLSTSGQKYQTNLRRLAIAGSLLGTATISGAAVGFGLLAGRLPEMNLGMNLAHGIRNLPGIYVDCWRDTIAFWSGQEVTLSNFADTFLTVVPLAIEEVRWGVGHKLLGRGIKSGFQSLLKIQRE